MVFRIIAAFGLSVAVMASPVFAHGVGKSRADHPAAHYIANEGLLVVDGDVKILFDPLFHNSYGQYRLPSEEQRKAMMAGDAPYDGVDAVFISHAHGDHFSAEDANAYLVANGAAKFVAPAQAVDAMRAADNWNAKVEDRITQIDLERLAPGREIVIAGPAEGVIEVFAVRIPHAGWPGRAEVQNIVYRVSLSDRATVLHMGDADPRDEHYAPYAKTWHEKQTDLGFPPYWFFLTPGGEDILYKRLNIKEAVGVHVPVSPPDALEATGDDFFSEPGEVRYIGETEKN